MTNPRLWTLARVTIAILTTLSWPGVTSADDWVEVESPHFRVMTNQGGRASRRVALDLERIHRLYQEVLPSAVSDPFRPVVAIVVEDDDGLVEWLPQYKDGERPGGVFFSQRAAHYMVIRLDAARETVYHEYLHLLTRLNVRRIPIWLNEGLADFYAATEFVGSKAKFGRIDEQKLRYLNSRSLIPLEELLGRTTNPHEDGNWIDIRVFYAQAWALTHYLMLGNDELMAAGALTRYMSLMEQGADPVETFVDVVGPLDEVREDLRRYIRRLRFRFIERELGDDLDDDAFDERDLPEDEALAERAVVMAGAGYVAEAEALLEGTNARDPQSPAVMTARGLVALHASDLPRAARAFSAAVAAGAGSYPPYYLSVVSSRSPDPELALELPEQIRRLRRAIALNPRFVPAYQELSRLLLNDGQLQEAFEAARQALELDTRDAFSWRLLGQAALLSNEIEAAREAADRGLSWARDDRSREILETFLADVDRHEERERHRAERRAAPAGDRSDANTITAPREPTPQSVAAPPDQARSAPPPTEIASTDAAARLVTMSGTWIELRCTGTQTVDFVIQSETPPTRLVVTAPGRAPVEIMGASGDVQERIGCGPVGRHIEVDLRIRRIDSGTVYGDLVELRFP